MDNEKILQIKKELFAAYPEAKCGLDYNSPFELLVATILSAQCTDKRVNIITKELFKLAPTPEKMLELEETGIKNIIQSCGLANSKAKNIFGTSQILRDAFNGSVPSEMEKLLSLPGVGRKTADVVRAEAFGIPAIAVDTHVGRVSVRIGLAAPATPEHIERQLMEVFPETDWIAAHHTLITHGRNICTARSPRCEACPINQLCEKNGIK